MGWTENEDKELVSAVAALAKGAEGGQGKVPWPQVEVRLKTLLKGFDKTAKSCRLRYINQMAPDINKSGMGANEDEAIMFLVDCWGSRWSDIADLISQPSIEKGRRTDNIVKNRYNANLRSTVVAPREMAVAACKAGRAKSKHWSILEVYISGLCDMRDWVLNTQDISPGPTEMKELDDKIDELKALSLSRKPNPVLEGAASRNTAIVPAEDPAPPSAPLKRKRSSSPGPSPAESPKGGRATSSTSTSQPLWLTEPAVYFQGPLEEDDRPSQRLKTEQTEPTPWILDEVLANCQWTADDSILEDQDSMLLEWQHSDYSLEHTPYMATTAMPTVPEVAVHDHAIGAEMAAPPAASGIPPAGASTSGSPPTRSFSSASDALDLDFLFPVGLEDCYNDADFNSFSGPIGMETGGW